MNRVGLLAVLSLLCGLGNVASPQESNGAAYVYEAFFRVDMANLEAWNESYFEHSVPVLEELQREGVIEGFGQFEHHTGGHYNIRFVARTYDWASIETFWDEYLTRLGERTSLPEVNRMIVEHEDQIWEIGNLVGTDDVEIAFVYSAMFAVNFADMDEWNTTWSDIMTEFVQDAVDEGASVGWVRLDHNTGGPHNSKHLYMFESWDDIDDFIFDRVLATLEQERPAVFDRLLAMIDFHDDIIWVPSTPD